MRRTAVATGLFRHSAYRRKQHVNAGSRDTAVVLGHGRQRRAGEAAEWMVVMPRYSQVAIAVMSDAQASLEGSRDDTEGEAVVSAKDRSRRKAGAIQHVSGGLIAQLFEIPVLRRDR